MSADKLLILFHEYGIDPAYLITDSCLKNDFDVDYYIRRVHVYKDKRVEIKWNFSANQGISQSQTT